jgi:hypothetical protein
MPAYGVASQRLLYLRVRACHSHRNPGPVPNVAARRCHGLDVLALVTGNHGGLVDPSHTRQVAHHPTGLVGQRKLDLVVELRGDVTQRGDDLKDHNLADDMSFHPYPRACGWPAG